MKLKIQDISPAKYNPRKMDDKTKKALKTSMSQFNDISGITWNKITGNIVTGHHRWGNLLDLYGQSNLEFKELSTDRYAIYDKKSGNDTGFILRVVEWDEAKEKAANVAANSDKLAGQFTVDLNSILEEIEDSLDIDLFTDLRFDDLDIPDFSNTSNATELLDGDSELIDRGMGEESEEVYTRKVVAPIYTPTGDKPDLSDIFDSSTTEKLIKEIKESNVSIELKKFLILAAHRHTKFNYKLIAEYYAHSNKEEQDLMEKSALVIIDFNKAIELGFVQLTKEIKEAYLDEQ